ncbi:hypothetical protein Mgra_00010091, partial [Meloidogyne graminicola]
NNLLDNFNKINIGSYPVGGGGAIPIQIPPTVYIIGNNPLIGTEEKGENTTQKTKGTTTTTESISENLTETTTIKTTTTTTI